MAKRICVLVFSAILMIGCFAGTVSGTESNVLFTFETLNSDGTLAGGSGLIGKDGTNPAKYENGILKMSTTGSENLFLTNGKIAETQDQYTVSVEFTVSEYTSSTVLEAIILLGETRVDFNHHRFEFKDLGAERTGTSNRPVHLRYQRRKVSDYLEKTTEVATAAKFNPGTWVRVDLLVDEANRQVKVYVNKSLIQTLTIDTAQLPLDGRIGFRGKGVSWRNLTVSKGLIDPAATATPTSTATATVVPTETPIATPTATQKPTDNPITSDTSILLPCVATLMVVAVAIVLCGYQRRKEQK